MQKEVNIIRNRTSFQNENILIKRIKMSEEQIKNGQVKDGDLVLSEMRKKYEY